MFVFSKGLCLSALALASARADNAHPERNLKSAKYNNAWYPSPSPGDNWNPSPHPGVQWNPSPSPDPWKPPKCGEKNEKCCKDAPFCDPSLGCDFNPADGGDPKCVRCGGGGGPCCQSSCGETCELFCDGGLTCDAVDNKCRSCGEKDDLCCDGEVCGPGLFCNIAGKCKDCGGSSEVCCPGDTCESGLACVDGQCETCGAAAGASCCPGNICESGFNCQGTECVVCGGVGEVCCDNAPDCDDGDCQGGICTSSDCLFGNGKSEAEAATPPWCSANGGNDACCKGCCVDKGSGEFWCTGSKPC